MPWRDSASVQVRASAIWPTAAAAWLSSSFSGLLASLSTARPSTIAPEETTRMSRLSRCRLARSAVSDASQDSLIAPALASTRSEEPTFTMMRRKSPSAGVFIGAGRMSLQLGFGFQLRLVLEAVVAGKPADQLAALPVVEDAAHILARDAGHGGKVALSDLLADDDAAGPDILAEILRQLEQCRGDAALERQETSGGDHQVGLAQSRRQQRDQRFVQLRMLQGECVESGAAEKAQRGIPHRYHRCRPRQPVDDRQLADDGAGAEEGEDALGAGARDHGDLEQPLLDAIAAVALVAGEKQHLVGGDSDRLGAGEQILREMLGQR